MLVKLYVQNYALIKDLDVELENGLTIITGETGAGKTCIRLFMMPLPQP